MYRPPEAADREFWLYFFQIFCPKRGPDGSGQPSGFIWTKFQAEPSILNPFKRNLMFLAPTGTLVGQDLGLAWLWTSLMLERGFLN